MREQIGTLTPTLSLSETLRGRGSRFDPLAPGGGEGQGEGERSTWNTRSCMERARNMVLEPVIERHACRRGRAA